jgi:hypothetical protein
MAGDCRVASLVAMTTLAGADGVFTVVRAFSPISREYIGALLRFLSDACNGRRSGDGQ